MGPLDQPEQSHAGSGGPVTTPEPMQDPAIVVVNAYITAMKQAFNPADTIGPPLGGGSQNVRFFAGEGPALAAFDAHTGGGRKCTEPFLWVRLARRYFFRPGQFPAPSVHTEDQCLNSLMAVAIEVGVGRCTVSVKAKPTWEEYAHEAEVSMDDSWRIGLALCMASKALRGPKRNVGIDTINPYGPDGGVIAQVGTAYSQL